MKEFTVIIPLWLHLVAAVIWIGGIATILFAVLPPARTVLGPEASKLMGAVSKRFTPMANASIFLLIVTGLVLMIEGSLLHGQGEAPYTWPFPLGLKLLLVSTMVLIHFYRNLFLVPKITRTSSEAQKGSLQRQSLNLVKANCAIGLAVLFLSGLRVVT